MYCGSSFTCTLLLSERFSLTGFMYRFYSSAVLLNTGFLSHLFAFRVRHLPLLYFFSRFLCVFVGLLFVTTLLQFCF